MSLIFTSNQGCNAAVVRSLRQSHWMWLPVKRINPNKPLLPTSSSSSLWAASASSTLPAPVPLTAPLRRLFSSISVLSLCTEFGDSAPEDYEEKRSGVSDTTNCDSVCISMLITSSLSDVTARLTVEMILVSFYGQVAEVKGCGRRETSAVLGQSWRGVRGRSGSGDGIAHGWSSALIWFTEANLGVFQRLFKQTWTYLLL